MMASAFDALLRPQVVHFAMNHALRVELKEVLRGATQAASSVSAALLSAIDRDPGPLKELARLRVVDRGLAAKLEAEVAQGASVAEEMAAVARRQRGHLDEGRATLRDLKLIVGPSRSEVAESFPAGGDDQLAKLELGSRLVVLADHETAAAGLYWQKTQQRLLHDFGCTVQLEVSFFKNDPTNAFKPGSDAQIFKFETDVCGQHLSIDAERHDDDFDFRLVDINSMMGGNAYWTHATDADSFPNPFKRLF